MSLYDRMKNTVLDEGSWRIAYSAKLAALAQHNSFKGTFLALKSAAVLLGSAFPDLCRADKLANHETKVINKWFASPSVVSSFQLTADERLFILLPYPPQR